MCELLTQLALQPAPRHHTTLYMRGRRVHTDPLCWASHNSKQIQHTTVLQGGRVGAGLAIELAGAPATMLDGMQAVLDSGTFACICSAKRLLSL